MTLCIAAASGATLYWQYCSNMDLNIHEQTNDHTDFHESWGRKINLFKFMFALLGLKLSFSQKKSRLLPSLQPPLTPPQRTVSCTTIGPYIQLTQKTKHLSTKLFIIRALFKDVTYSISSLPAPLLICDV